MDRDGPKGAIHRVHRASAGNSNKATYENYGISWRVRPCASVPLV
jgi:hypothetical protein